MSDGNQEQLFAELLALCEDRTNPAFGEALLKFMPVIAPMVRKSGRGRLSPSQIEELLGEIVGEIWEAFEKFDADQSRTVASFRGWLKRIVHNKGVDMVRRNQRSAREVGADDLLDQVAVSARQPRSLDGTSPQLRQAILSIGVKHRMSTVVAVRVFTILERQLQRFLVVAERNPQKAVESRIALEDDDLEEFDRGACADADRYAAIPDTVVAEAKRDLELAELFGLLEGLGASEANAKVQNLARDRHRYGPRLLEILARDLGITLSPSKEGAES